MTQQQSASDPFLSELLQNSPAHESRPPAQTADHAALSSRDAFSLMREANSAGTPTLAPTDTATNAAAPESAVAMAETFAGEMLEFVRRHPVPTLVAAVGVAFLFTRRRS